MSKDIGKAKMNLTKPSLGTGMNETLKKENDGNPLELGEQFIIKRI